MSDEVDLYPPCPLETAFARLALSGIDANHNFACCGSCGAHELASAPIPRFRGYAFYHVQDTEAAADRGELYIGYGAYNGRVRAGQFVARRICKELRDAGLQCDWDGQVTTRIRVTLTRADKDFLQELLDQDYEDYTDADAAVKRQRLQTLFQGWRRAKLRSRRARRVIGAAVLEWAARPGGILYRKAHERYETQAAACK